MPDYRRPTDGPRPGSRWSRDDRGAVAVIVALLMVIFMLLLAFVVDFGRVYAAKAQLQNAADAAALAGAKDLPVSVTAASTAQAYAVANGALSAGIQVVSPYGGNQRAIAVTVSQEVPYTFGRFAGLSGQNVTARAVATKASSALGNFAFFTENDLDNNGNPTINGDVYAGVSVSIGGNSAVNGSVWAGGRASAASSGIINVNSGSAQITGNATATGPIITNRPSNILGTRTQNGVVPNYTATGYAQSVGLESTVERVGRIAVDQADLSRREVTGTCSLADALSTTTVLICSGQFSTASNNDWAALRPSLRTIIAASFNWTGQQTMGSWPNSPFLLYATSGGLSGSGGATLNGYLYAPNGGLNLTGGTDGDFRAITSGDISVRGNMTTAQVSAYEDAILGGVRLTE